MANYNYGRFLGQALESVLEQTYKNYEVVVCDGGSTDESRNVLSAFASRHGQVRVLLEENRGSAEAILSAYQASRGEVICFLDSDDTFLPPKLEEIVKVFAASPGAGFAVNRLTATDESLRMMRPVPVAAKLVSGWKAPEMPLRSPQMLWGMPPTTGISLRRAVADRVLPHLRGRKVFHDAVIQVLAPVITPIVAIEYPLGLYRIHRGNTYALGRFTVADFERMSHVDTELWRVWRSFIMTIAPNLPRNYPLPPEDGLSVLNYAYARRSGDPLASKLFREVISGPWFASMPGPYRWFWRSAVFLPDWLFETGFNFIYGKGWAKNVISRVASLLRTHRVSDR